MNNKSRADCAIGRLTREVRERKIRTGCEEEERRSGMFN